MKYTFIKSIKKLSRENTLPTNPCTFKNTKPKLFVQDLTSFSYVQVNLFDPLCLVGLLGA